MSIIPEKFKIIIKPARDGSNNIIPGICVICGEKSKDKTSHICDDYYEDCWKRAIERGYIVPVKE